MSDSFENSKRKIESSDGDENKLNENKFDRRLQIAIWDMPAPARKPVVLWYVHIHKYSHAYTHRHISIHTHTHIDTAPARKPAFLCVCVCVNVSLLACVLMTVFMPDLAYFA